MTQEEKLCTGIDALRASCVIQHNAASGSAAWWRAMLLFSVALLLAAPLSGAESGPSAVAACPPAIQWQPGLGDDTNQRFHRVLNRSDGGYIVGGQYFGRDVGIWLVALLPNGSNAWQRFYGATGSHYLNDLQPTQDGGYIIAGTARLPGNNERDYQAELTRINANGDVLWTRTYGGSDLDAFQSARQTKDGGFIAAGGSWAPTGPDKTSPHHGKGDVPNILDQCPDTPPGAVVNGLGCGIPQLCPCDGSWKNHGEYVRSVTDHAWQFYRDDLISAAERREFIRDAATSDCGRRHGVRLQLQP